MGSSPSGVGYAACRSQLYSVCRMIPGAAELPLPGPARSHRRGAVRVGGPKSGLPFGGGRVGGYEGAKIIFALPSLPEFAG